MAEARRYRFVEHISDENSFEQIEYEPGKFLLLDSQRQSPGVELTDDQHDKLARFVVLEEDTDEHEEVPQPVDQAADAKALGPSTSTAGISGTTLVIDETTSAEELREAAEELDLPKGGSKKELRERITEKQEEVS